MMNMGRGLVFLMTLLAVWMTMETHGLGATRGTNNRVAVAASASAKDNHDCYSQEMIWRKIKSAVASAVIILPRLVLGAPAVADDELANYAAQGKISRASARR